MNTNNIKKLKTENWKLKTISYLCRRMFLLFIWKLKRRPKQEQRQNLFWLCPARRSSFASLRKATHWLII